MRARVLPVVTALLCAAACGPAPTTSPEQIGTRGAALKNQCDDFLCGGNSPLVGELPFWELDETGVLPSSTGMWLSQVSKAGQVLTLDVTAAWPRAFGPGVIYQGNTLVGATLTLQSPAGPFSVQVTDFRQVSYYDGGPGPRIAAFRLQYPVLDPKTGFTTLVDVCPYEAVDDHGVAGTWAILSSGDRFDRATTTINVTGPAVGPWFNVSCAGDVIAKLLRIRHAYAAEDGAHHTTWKQRQAALNMFTAKYCPGGPLQTVFGQPLTWADQAGWSTLAPFTTYEAIWTANGAYCLRVPRLAAVGDVPCAPPPCTAADLAAWKTHGGLLSANP